MAQMTPGQLYELTHTEEFYVLIPVHRTTPPNNNNAGHSGLSADMHFSPKYIADYVFLDKGTVLMFLDMEEEPRYTSGISTNKIRRIAFLGPQAKTYYMRSTSIGWPQIGWSREQALEYLASGEHFKSLLNNS